MAEIPPACTVIFTRAGACSGHASYDEAGTGSIRPLPAPGRAPGRTGTSTLPSYPDDEQFLNERDLTVKHHEVAVGGGTE